MPDAIAFVFVVFGLGMLIWAVRPQPDMEYTNADDVPAIKDETTTIPIVKRP